MNHESCPQSNYDPHLASIGAIGIEAISARGHGVFTADSLNFAAGFSILRQLSYAVIILRRAELGIHVHIPLLLHRFSLSGSLDDGRSIRVENLHAHLSNESTVEMTPMNCAVEIGEKSASRPLCAKYTLTGLYHGNIDFNFQDWKIQICADRDSIAKARASKALKIPLDGATLNLSNSSQDKTEDDYDEFAGNVFSLLSLASGNGVTSHCWRYSFSDGQDLELWRPRWGDDIGPGPIVDHAELGLFLQKCLPCWLELSDEDRYFMLVAITHLNTSGLGFLDNRLLQVAQIWELLATEWGPKKAMPPEILHLKNGLKSFLGKWRDDNPGCDPNGIVSGRVVNSMDWITLLRRMDSMIEAFGLQAHLIGLDIARLKDARDNAAHSISVGVSDGNREDMVRLLLSALTGIQLLLLRKLNYSGSVIYHNNGWRAVKSIESFFAHT
jgi:hypothetical protein